MRNLYLSLFLLLSLKSGYAQQGIRGVVQDETGGPLPHASVYVKEKGIGTSSNSNGRYELRLPPGSYEVTWQFVGYTAEVHRVQVKEGFTTLDVQLEPQAEMLGEVAVTGSREDPAYTIMRKAIAKAPYHLVQCDSYSAEVYMKGSGGLSKIPGLFEKAAEKDGVDTGRVFTSESVSIISFERPATFKEKVVSVRTSGEELEGADPNAYVNSSFYKDMVVDAVSPFSRRAMSYYRFRYQGNFEDRGHKIHKIEVTPRSAGDRVFVGSLYIRDGYWNIHSLDLNTRVQFFDVHLVQFFAPVQDEIWMPVTQKYEFGGSFFGFAGHYRYMASVSNYQINKNDELTADVALVDEEIEEPPEDIAAIKKRNVEDGVKEVFEEEKEVSGKQFRKLMKEYEKAERKKSGEKDILYDRTYEIDSAAANRDSAYWANIRPVPLTPKEEEGYRKDDSTYAVERGDSSALRKSTGFDVNDIFFGGRYWIAKKHLIEFPGLVPRLRFNTVEGFNFDVTGSANLYLDSGIRIALAPTVRYGFASEQLYYKLNTGISTGPSEQRTNWNLEGGHFIRQFHPDAIHPFVNSVYSLFLERNYMKLYQKDYVEIGYSRDIRYKFNISASAEWASRSSLNNSSEYSIVDSEGRAYSSNIPANVESPSVVFSNSRAFKTDISLAWKPWLKYRKYNGRLIPIEETSPEFRLGYRAGWNGILGSEASFQQVEMGFKDEWRLGVRATVDIDAEAGTFFDNSSMLFMDYKHFNGGLTELAPLNVTGNYRAIDYYLYSTKSSYVSALSHIRFRKFLFTQIPAVRLVGIKENLFVNYLKTAHSPHYSEIGYGIDNIFRILRIELVQSFEGSRPKTFGVRVGVGSIFE